MSQANSSPFKFALTFDDVLLEPAFSSVLPNLTDSQTRLGPDFPLAIPLISAAMDTVTEAEMAIAMAQNGGLGIIHKNFTPEEQADQVRRVKNYEAGMVVNPKTVAPDASLAEALNIMRQHSISGLPVVSEDGRLAGILTNRDVRFVADDQRPVRTLMTAENLITTHADVSRSQAMELLHQHRIEKLLVVDDRGCLAGLITVKDIEKATAYPNASKDKAGRLRVGAATGAGPAGRDRAAVLIDAGVDLVVVDTAHGHSQAVLETIEEIKREHPEIFVIGGNVATADGAKALIDHGVDAVKVGIGPGSICTTRIVAGVGVPQLAALLNAVEVCQAAGVAMIADGGIRASGDLAKAIAAGASCAMMGSMLAGTDEAPGEVFLYQGRSYKAYRGMGSIGAMARGSADRYFQQEIGETMKLVPEGIEGRVPYRGPVAAIIHQLVGGLKAAMGYTGHSSLQAMRGGCKFVQVSQAGVRESHVHDVAITREAPNYRREF